MNSRAIEKINRFLQCPIEFNPFTEDAYFRMNMLYISPYNIHRFKEKLTNMGMFQWGIDYNSMFFEFIMNNNEYKIVFAGKFTFYCKQNEDQSDFLISGIELDFEPTYNSEKVAKYLNKIESYLKGLDVVFFLTYNINIDEEILHNPLSESLEFMYNKIIQNKKSC